MILDRIQWKFVLENGDQLSTAEFFRELSSFIPDSPEVYVDVVDYRHVFGGPKILLSGFYSDFIFDHTDQIWSLTFAQKRPVPGDDLTVLKNTLGRALTCFKKLNFKNFSVAPLFLKKELRLVVNDRAAAPNTNETFISISPLVKTVLDDYSKGALRLDHVMDSKRRFEIVAHFESEQDFFSW